MSNTNILLKLDGDVCDIMLDETVNTDPRCQEALEKYKEILKSLTEKNLAKTANEIDAAVVFREAVIQEVIYKKAFHDGMRFILNTMTGKDVIEI
jgi:lactate dehydrogenase-like 2-hydroxyacid dehydrogenase